MENSCLTNRIIDWKSTESNVIKILKKKLRPISYNHLFEDCICWKQDNNSYSNKTDPKEKFRQHYAEQYQNEVGFAKGGFLFLRHWFPDKGQLTFLSPVNKYILKGNCLTSYDAGYETAKREPYMKDHFNDRNTEERYQKTRESMICEHHIREFFKTNYPQNYKPPTNEHNFKIPAKDDFSLVINNETKKIDVKKFCYSSNNGRGIDYTVIRNVDNDIIYIISKMINENTIEISGIISGKHIRMIGEIKSNPHLTHIAENHIFDFECLLVMLNMDNINKNYLQFYKLVKEYKYRNKIG